MKGNTNRRYEKKRNQARRVGTLDIIRAALLEGRLATLFLVGDAFLFISQIIRLENRGTYGLAFSLSLWRPTFRWGLTKGLLLTGTLSTKGLFLTNASGILGTGSIAATTLAGPSELALFPQPNFCLLTSESTLGLFSLASGLVGVYPDDILNGDMEGNSDRTGGGVGGVSLVNCAKIAEEGCEASSSGKWDDVAELVRSNFV
jgi:hypothetical protein